MADDPVALKATVGEECMCQADRCLYTQDTRVGFGVPAHCSLPIQTRDPAFAPTNLPRQLRLGQQPQIAAPLQIREQPRQTAIERDCHEGL